MSAEISERQDQNVPEWLIPGAEVVVYTMTRDGTIATLSTVTTVGKRFFSVHSHDEKFLIRTLSYRPPGAFNTATRVVPASSTEGQNILAQDARRRAIETAQSKVYAWQRSPESADRIADAITALQALDQNCKEPGSCGS